MKDKKLDKVAIIRGKDLRECPFRLPVNIACGCAGDSVSKMAPIDIADGDQKEEEKIAKGNKMVYVYAKTGERCTYADKILEVAGKVDCDFEDTGAGYQSTPFTGSPLYPRTFSGIGRESINSVPLGYYSDNNQSRNIFFGLFSLIGHKNTEELIKLADDYDKSGEKEKADIVDNLVNTLDSIRGKYPDDFAKIEKYLSEYRNKHNNERKDTGLFWELSEQWLSPRNPHR